MASLACLVPWWGWLGGMCSWGAPWNPDTCPRESSASCTAAAFPRSERFKRKEVEAAGLLSLDLESLLP